MGALVRSWILGSGTNQDEIWREERDGSLRSELQRAGWGSWRLSCQETAQTYGPGSDGVTGSDGGGGRLIRVGVAILKM